MSKVSANPFQREVEEFHSDYMAAMDRVLKSGWYILGKEVEAFEKEFAAYLGSAHGIGCASGLDALMLSLKAFGIGPGDEVITTPLSAVATALAISHLGAYLLISAGEDSWFNRTVLGSRIFVGIGLISYPLYLWHWPLFSFLRILRFNSAPVILAATALSFFLAWLTYELLEKYIRRSRQALSLVCMMGLVFSIGSYAYFKEGVLTNRLARSAEVSTSLVFGKNSEVTSSKFCPPAIIGGLQCHADDREKPKYLILGDSQSLHLFYGLVARSNPGERWINAYGIGHLFLEKTQFKSEYYNGLYQTAIQGLTEADVRLVLIVNAVHILEHANKDSLRIDFEHSVKSEIEGISRLISRLESSGKQVVLMVPSPSISDSNPID